MRNSVFYGILGTCALASAAMAYSLLTREPPEKQSVQVPTVVGTEAAAVQAPKREPEWKCDVTLANYKDLVVSMSYSRVRAIFGCEGRENHRSDYAGRDTYVTYYWDIPGGGFTSISFKNDGLTDKGWYP